jgi:hypothetical protein
MSEDNLPDIPLDELKKESIRRFGVYKESVKKTARDGAAWGETLIALKDRLPHGDWIDWFEESFDVKIDAAQRAMRLAREWPQIEAAFEADPKMSFNKAFKLLPTLSSPKATPTGKASEFLFALQKVAAGLGRGLKQSDHFAFKNGEVFTYNEELACRCKVNVDFEGAVLAKPLLEMLKKMTEEDIEIVAEDGKLILRRKRQRAEFELDPKITLPIDEIEKPKTWKKLPDNFEDAVLMVSTCLGGPKANYFGWTCIHIHPEWIEACDTIQLCRWRLRMPIKPEEEFLVLGNTIKKVMRMGHTEFALTPSWFHLHTDYGFAVSCRLYREENIYPDLTPIVKGARGGTPLVLPKALMLAADKAGVFSVENTDANLIRIRLRKDRVLVNGDGTNGRFFQSIPAKWEGKNVEFIFSPILLNEIRRHHSKCEIVIDPPRLVIRGERWKYIACLGPPEKEDEEEGRVIEIEVEFDPANPWASSLRWPTYEQVREAARRRGMILSDDKEPGTSEEDQSAKVPTKKKEPGK